MIEIDSLIEFSFISARSPSSDLSPVSSLGYLLTPIMTSSSVSPGRGHILVITALITVTVAALAVILRCVTRGKVAKSLGWDDWILVLSLVRINQDASRDALRFGF